MEENTHTEGNPTEYKDFEKYDIIQEVDLVSLNATLISVLMHMNPILAATLKASLIGLSIDEIEKMGEQSEIDETYLNYIRQAKEDEKNEWNSISRIKSYTSILITIFNSSNEVFSLRHASWNYSGYPISDFDIQPLDHLSITLRHETPVLKTSKTRRPTSINHNFSFESPSHAFEFSTLIKLQSKYQAFSFSTPINAYREHKTHSTGRTPLKCSSQISRKLSNSPYSYAIAITLG